MDKIPIPNDWNEDDDGYTFVWFCIPNSPLWRGVVRGKIYELTRGRIWDEVTGNIKDTQAIAWEIYEGICMACSDELFARLDRIAEALESTRAVLAPATPEHTFLEYAQELEALGANANAGDPIMVSLQNLSTSLENINQKAVERVTWEEFIEDLADTLGVTNALYGVIKWIGDLFPRVRIKMDFTTIALDLWEYFRWKMPIIALLTGATTSLATIAAAQVAERPLSLIRTILGGFNSALNVNNRIYEFVLGNWNWYDNVFKPLWDSFISDDEGGTGGDDPDGDTANRAIARVYNDVFVEGNAMQCSPDVTVNCGGGGGCSGGGALGSPITGSLTDSDPAEEPGDPQIDPPPTGFDSWAEYDLHKCRAANFIAQGTEQLFRLLGSANSYVSAGAIAGAGAAITELLFGAASIAMSAGVLGGAAGVSLLAGGVILTLPGWVVGAIVAALLAVIVVEVSILLLFINAADEYHANIEQTVCDLYNAQTVEDAKNVLSTAWGDAIASFAIEPPYNAWEAAIRSMMSTVIGYVITNTLVNMLFSPSDLVDKYTDAPVDCDTCLDEGVFDFTIDEQNWLVDEVVSVNGEYDDVNNYFWGHYEGTGTAILKIYYPTEPVTINTLRMWVYGTGQEIDIINILTADDVEGEWTNAYTQTDVPTPGLEPGGFTIVEFTDLNITDKYIGIYLHRFWAGAAVDIQRVEWE